MPPSSEAPRDLADRVIRQALQHPANLRAFLHQAVPALAGGFDCERGRLLEREFPLDDWRRREADLPFEVPYRLGDDELWALVYVLIEHQRGEDPVMPLRLLYFVVLYWERQWRAWKQAAAPKPPLRLSRVLPLVLHTGPGPWQENRTLHDRAGRHGLPPHGHQHQHRPAHPALPWRCGTDGPPSPGEQGDDAAPALAHGLAKSRSSTTQTTSCQ